MNYDDHLDRALDETSERAHEGGRFEVPDVEVRSEGNETVFENFQEVVDRLDRDPGHVLQFLQGELGTSAGIDESGRARLTGDFRPDRIAAAIDDYTEAFVICPECGLSDTRLENEQETKLIKCEACGALSPTGT